MNSPSDSVEFYATNRKVSDELGSAAENSEELKKFSEVKQKDVVSYTEGKLFYNVTFLSHIVNFWLNTVEFLSH